jgi:hypothetical protein
MRPKREITREPQEKETQMKSGLIARQQNAFPFSGDAITSALYHYLVMIACAQGGYAIACETIQQP